MKKIGGLENALKKYRQIKKQKVQVGIFESATYAQADKEPLHVAQVAYWNEYGTANIPARSFFRKTVRQNKSKWIKNLPVLAKEHGNQKALSLTGEMIKGDLVESIMTWSDPPNSKATISIKGIDAPLRDTMQMARSIGVEISDNDES